MTTKCNVAPWAESWNRKRAFNKIFLNLKTNKQKNKHNKKCCVKCQLSLQLKKKVCQTLNSMLQRELLSLKKKKETHATNACSLN